MAKTTWFNRVFGSQIAVPKVETPQKVPEKVPDWRETVVDLTIRIENLERLVDKLIKNRTKRLQQEAGDRTNEEKGAQKEENTVDIGGKRYILPGRIDGKNS